MVKFVRGFIAVIASLFLIAALLTVILCIMECVTVGSIAPLVWLFFAAGCGVAGSVIMKAVDKKCDEEMEARECETRR